MSTGWDGPDDAMVDAANNWERLNGPVFEILWEIRTIAFVNPSEDMDQVYQLAFKAINLINPNVENTP